MESDNRFSYTKNVVLEDEQSEVVNMTKNQKAQPVPSPKVDPPKDLADMHKVVASDFTDFEAHLCDVQDHEDLADKISRQLAPQKGISDVCKLDLKAFENAMKNVTPSPKDGFEATYLEDSATDDEVLRAGGFGATDDISSFLPVASDFTDFEAHLRNAEDYENLEKQIARPGLGWTNNTK